MSEGIQLFVGLGNPGSQYAQTRHNVGAWFVSRLAEQSHATLKNETKFHGASCKTSALPKPVWLFIPSTFMNESGKAVAAIARFYKVSPESILVAHDELDFEPGDVRLKLGGGHGGHNGLRDIVKLLGSNNFMRLRIGIGHPGHKDQVSSYVLNKPSVADKKHIDDAIDEALCVVDDLVEGSFQRALTRLHSE